MELTEHYRRTTSAFLSAAMDPSRWSEALRALLDACGGGTAHVLAVSRNGGAPLMTVFEGHEQSWVDAFAEYYAHHTPFFTPWEKSDESGPKAHTALVPEPELLRTEYYNDWMRPQGDIYGGGSMRVGRSRASSIHVGTLLEARRRDEQQALSLQLMSDMAPVIRHAWEVNQRLAGNALERMVLAEERPGDPAILVLDERGRPDFVNAVAQGELAQGSVLRAGLDGRIRFAAEEADTALRRALHATRSGAPPESVEHLAAGGGRPIRATFARFDPVTIDGWHLGATLGLTGRRLLITLAEEAAAPDPAERLQARYPLARAEAEVTVALWRGLDPSAIAATRNVSVNTVRNQIKSAAAKCGVRRQAELVALVAGVMAPS